MALDSRNKRMSMICFDLPSGRVAPNPDGTVSAADRQQWLGKYPGIAFSAPGAAVVFLQPSGFFGPVG